MLSGINEKGWVIKFAIDTNDLANELDRYAKELEQLLKLDTNKVAKKLERTETRKINKRKNKGKKNPAKLKSGRRSSLVGGRLGIKGALERHIIPDLIKHLDAVRKTTKDLKFDNREEYTRVFQEETKKIVSNVESRLNIAFPKDPGRIGNAVSDSRFSGTNYNRNKKRFFAGIGNVEVLDEWTSIYINKDGSIYEPPQDYGNIEAFWRFWEFTGVGVQKEFKSPQSYWTVVTRGWLRKEDLAPRPFLLNNGRDYYDEDKVIIKGIGKKFLDIILNRITKSGSGINTLTNKFFGR